MLAIVITDSTGTPHYHPLPAETGRSYSIGRAENCDFSLPHEQTLSDVHCFLSVVDGYVYLQDNNSTNGILAGTRPVSAEYMTTEREYVLGNCRLMLLPADEATAPQTVAQAPVRKVAKLKPKAVSSAPAPQPEPEQLPPTYAEQQPIYEQPIPQPQPARRVAKLKAKTVTAAAPPTPAYVQPAYIEPQPEPIAEQTTEVYIEPQPEPIAEQPAEVYIEPQPEPIAEQPAEVYIEPQPEPIAEQPAEVYIEPQPEPIAEQPTGVDSPSESQPSPAPTVTSGTEQTPRKKTGRKATRVHATKAGQAAARAIYEPEEPRSGTLAELPRDFGLKVRLINDRNNLTVGTPLRFGFTADCNCHVYLLQYDSTGQAALLVPGEEDIAHKLFQNIETQFPSVSCKDYDLMVEEPVGHEVIIALACTVESNFAKVWQELVNSAAGQTAPGELELQAIAAAKAPNGAWASFVINIFTKNA
ncbi:MAG: DUF4384 domain-containing protein [Akkermansia sp.]|nr:DUF4384 domain-containing protein [Akkermansia sp.]